MAKQMVKDNIPSNYRQMAAIVIKNSIVGPSKEITDELYKKWLAIPVEQRDFIKQMVIYYFLDNHLDNREC